MLLPAVVELCEPAPDDRVVDVGCGIGDLSARLAGGVASVVGLDSSPASIALARRLYGDRDRLEFVTSELLDYAGSAANAAAASLVVSNMFLMAVRDLASALFSIRSCCATAAGWCSRFRIPHSGRGTPVAATRRGSPTTGKPPANGPTAFPPTVCRAHRSPISTARSAAVRCVAD